MYPGTGNATASQIADAAEKPRKPRDVASIAGAIDAAGRARQSLNTLAEMAEAVREKLGGPQPRGAGESEKDPSAPRCVVDQLHAEVRGMTDPLTRIEFALRDIDLRIG